METSYSAEQETFRASLRRFLEDRGGTDYTRSRWQAGGEADGELLGALAELGVTGLLVPEDAGGLGGKLVDMGVVMEELGRAVIPAPGWSSCVGGTSAAAVFDCGEMLAQLAAGDKTASVAVAEPGATFSRWRSSQTRAAGDHLSGTKTEVPDGLSADVFFITTDSGVYLVERGAAGVAVESAPTLDGSHHLATLTLDNAPGLHLGDNDRLAPVIDRMLVALCADGLGAAQRALEMTVAYAGERQQFGSAIGSFQSIAHLCAQMLQTIELGRAGLHYALWAQDGAGPEEAHRAAVMAKAYMADSFVQIGADAIQIFGGAGFTWEYDIQLYYKRLLSLQMLWGNAAVWLEELATLVIDGAAPPLIPD